MKQQGAELRVRCEKEQKNILDSAGITPKVIVPSSKTLALKSAVGLNTNQMRRTRYFMKSMGVRFQNEQHETSLKDRMLISSNLQAENVEFEEKNPSIRGKIQKIVCPMVYVHDVCEFVHKRLDDLDEAGQLHWRNATIPPDEVWVKIGGDHGGGSFKVKY